MTAASPAAPLGIVAGRGELPLAIRRACEREGRPFFIVAIKGCGEHVTQGLPADGFAIVRLDKAGAALAALRQAGARELVLAGGVDRPALWSLRPDWTSLRFVFSIGLKLGGENSILEAVRDALQDRGFRLRGADELVQGLLSEQRLYSRKAPSRADRADIAQAWRIAKTLGTLDAGQGAIVQRSFILAIEAVEGTDAMIARAGTLKRGRGGGVLVKVMKPQQDRRLDTPTIGPATVEALAQAGLAGMVIEAGAALVLNEMKLVELANRHGLFVIGMSEGEALAGAQAAAQITPKEAV
jgi:DUF1009 family protein